MKWRMLLVQSLIIRDYLWWRATECFSFQFSKSRNYKEINENNGNKWTKSIFFFFLKKFCVTMSKDKTWIKVFQGDERIRINYSWFRRIEDKIRASLFNPFLINEIDTISRVMICFFYGLFFFFFLHATFCNAYFYFTLEID